ncbi:MAG: 2-succinyl-5-enolpyruvyl-6-hydroxy-3-cyclohexene-1-carboxylic-acid synthase, partial [Armatimonadetes bacterium]|nr:2-succinyl-5-enolpyruvyl-6-hydroxy-3-cyclohexene-1-carboxylic-acid synthase [Armatimonadota bacterium]
MNPENAAYAYIGAAVDDLVRSHVTHLVLCPGSRSTPLALCAARHPGMKVWTLLDERSAGFFALGLAKALRRPAAVLSTSGTAAANFLPAVVEARYGRVPLVVLTADRPHELRDAGANQTIDQIRLYGTHAKWFADAALPEATEGMLRYARSLVCQAVATALEAPRGPVHLNFPLREPLVPVAASGGMPPEEDRVGAAWEGRPGQRAFTVGSQSLRVPDPHLVEALAADLGRARRGLIVCGPQDDPALPQAVGDLAVALQFPVLADPLSQVRCGPHDRSLVIDTYDAMLRLDDLAAALAPEVILRIGAVSASRPLLQYLQRHHGSRQIFVDGDGGWHDPMRLAFDVLHVDPRLLCEALSPAVRAADGTSGSRAAASAGGASDWAGLWLRMAAHARRAMALRLAGIDEPFEGKVFAELAHLLPAGSILYVGNSMP